MSIIKSNILFWLGWVCVFTPVIAKSQDSIFFFQSKADVEIERDGKKESFTAHIRFNTRDTLWISLTGALGIEGARLLITEDSTYIINKLDKTTTAFSSKEENPFIPYIFDIKDWRLLLLNIPYTLDSHSVLNSEDSSYTVYESTQSKKIVYKNRKIERCYYNQMQQAINCEVVYSDYVRPKNQKREIAMSRKLMINNPSEDTVHIFIKYVDYKLNTPMPFVFNFAKYRNEENK